MTTMKRLAIGSSMLFVTTLAFAEFTSVELLDATKTAVEAFEANNAHAEHFIGYKAWKTGADAKVKIYVDHGGMAMEFDYLCIKYEDATECQSL